MLIDTKYFVSVIFRCIYIYSSYTAEVYPICLFCNNIVLFTCLSPSISSYIFIDLLLQPLPSPPLPPPLCHPPIKSCENLELLSQSTVECIWPY